MKAKMNPYEKQREDRIKRNNEVLIQMGILTAASALDEAILSNKRPGLAKTTKRARISPSKEAVITEPSRRSSRLKGEAPAVQHIEVQKSYRTCSKTSDLLHACLRPSNPHGPTDLDVHNMYRIRTMSDSALRRRIYTIQRCDKLQSYVQVLTFCGMDDLSEEAQQQLLAQFAL